MNKKIRILLFSILGVLIIFFYLSIFGIQTVTTDKKEYQAGEEVKITTMDIELHYCSCTEPELYIKREQIQGAANGESNYPLTIRLQEGDRSIVQNIREGPMCLDGEVRYPGMCDVVMCSIPRFFFRINTHTWDGKVYVRNGTTQTCGTHDFQDRNMSLYHSVPAESGTYTIRFGKNSKTIRIQ
jgi:hypothetical protein